ncbi:GTP cyclohydrolase FolE2 [Phenylobacterium sp.]|uniref:GTP cyclohydrolase FolE2 n=1 Tax=Phenylobacterium sp. TaxID=1871053 RepID=UPI0025D7324B|nr:GTP cyclohydrolase FolE2 [Phenylobacterium sp.]
MNIQVPVDLPDVQASADLRNLAIQRVGVKSVTHPVWVATRDGAQPSVATVDMYVRLPAHLKGTHMSRFLEVLGAFEAPLSAETLGEMMTVMLGRLEADSGLIEFRLPYFVRKTAPVSGVASLLDYQVTLRAEQADGRLEVTQQVLTPVTSLCPCSKQISLYGAHNQRSHIVIAATLAAGVSLPIEDLIDIAESSASCELWGLLKRPDEKYVTERAYENPKFVEDLVRDIAVALAGDARVARYEVSSENFESIHNHSAYAWLTGPQ